MDEQEPGTRFGKEIRIHKRFGKEIMEEDFDLESLGFSRMLKLGKKINPRI